MEYSPEGRLISMRVRREEMEACMNVSDEGVGIPRAEQARLFERFYRAENATGAGIGGLSIGLAVVMDIVT